MAHGPRPLAEWGTGWRRPAAREAGERTRLGQVAGSSAEARKWQRVIRASVREACQTWRVQAQAGPVTTQALEAIINRAAVPILDLLQDQPPEAVAALAPSVVRMMLWAVVEMQAEQRAGR